MLEPGTRLDTWDYESATKADGGAVYIEVEGDGQVSIRKGLQPKRKGARGHGDSTSEPDAGSAPAERPEMTQALAGYADLVRHSAVRLAVARTLKVALRLLVAHTIGGAKWWKVGPERQRRTAKPSAPPSPACRHRPRTARCATRWHVGPRR